MIHHWRDLDGNPFTVNVDLSMLLREGLVIQRKIRLKGQPRDGSPLPVGQVRYDTDYVVSKLKRTFLDPLNCKTQKELQSLILKALDNQAKGV